MNDKTKGFTIAEMMLAIAIMSVILLITVTFFRAQSKTAGTTTRERSSRQGISLALNQIQRDILQGGSVWHADRPPLAFMFGDNLNANVTHPNSLTVDTQDPRFISLSTARCGLVTVDLLSSKPLPARLCPPEAIREVAEFSLQSG